MTRPVTRRADDRGNAMVELVWLGTLLLLPLIWVVVSIGEVQAGAFGTLAAARAAGRAYALAPDDATGAERASAAARQALADQGMADAPMEVTVTCQPYPDDCHAGTSVITVHVASEVALPLLPDVLGSGRPSFGLDATHTVPVGQFQEVG
ncbi:hypothetical protein [Nocardioides sp. AX2bis]|uniref:hypothetical protein n=1 Tax=Nocardioides sp. AX2bis TaxID=2653157 RepID=UPI0012EFC96B|nr:hypothetical protein [Nocardioides sp. AX2bis]VXB92575.1 conserved hypothetical protein [Nocardioides sp. AX2bis]